MPHSAWMPLYWGDYFQDTLEFSTFQHGVYLLLIGAYWARGGPLPNDPQALAKIARTSCDKLTRFGNPILAKFTCKEGLLYHSRIEKELLRSSERLESARANGRAGGLAKSYLTTSTSTKEESKKENILNFVVGKNGNGSGSGVTIKDPAERLARFQKWLAESFPHNGWDLVAAAADKAHPQHEIALTACKRQARSLGKGWPTQWPS
jgi:uncharacterized protein YdaU (DUF1376 family)